MSITEVAAAPKAAAHRHTILSVDDPEFMNDWMGQSFAFDLETSGLDANKERILGIAFTFADGRSYYLVFEHTVLEADEVVLRRFMDRSDTFSLLAPLFNQPEIIGVCHNSKFELHFLKKLGVLFNIRLADTMLAAQLVDENRRVGLKSLAPTVGMQLNEYSSLHAYPGYSKHEILGVPLEATAQYAMDDTEATWLLWNRLQREMKREGVEDAFNNIWMPCCVALQEMEAKGIALDMPKVEQALVDYEVRAQTALRAIWQDGMQMVLAKLEELDDWRELPAAYAKPLRDVEHLGERLDNSFFVWDTEVPILRLPRKNTLERVPWFNPGSVQQLRGLLFDWHAISTRTDIDLNLNAKGEVSADKDTLKVLAHELGESAPAVLNDILEYRKCSKLVSTYLKPFINLADRDDHNCLRTNFNQTIAKTGRLSSSNPINLQNIPSRGPEGKACRSMFVARPGHMLVVADYNMMELRMAAHFSRDPEMMRAFREGLDLHTLTAASQNGLLYEDMEELLEEGDVKAKGYRHIGKTSNFCVPLDTLCLTRSGWKTYQGVVPGVDETVGYNPETGMSEWTPIKEVHVFDDAPLMRISNAYWSAVTTPEHRWYASWRAGYRHKRVEEGFVATQALTQEHRLHLSAILRTEGTSPATPQEAAIVAWLWTDGTTKRSKFVGAPSQAGGNKVYFHAEIYQKSKFVDAIDALLVGVPHTRNIRKSGIHVWHLAPQYVRSLWDRLQLDALTPEHFVLSLSEQARKAFLDAAWQAEGHTTRYGLQISQNYGPVCDALRMAVFLEGFRPTEVHDTDVHCKIGFGQSRVTGQRLKKEELGRGPVWCVTTELGTWTMRQGNSYSLTGNSLLYGMGPKKFQRFLLVQNGTKVSYDDAWGLIESFNDTYAGITKWKRQVEKFAQKYGYVTTLRGRKRRLPDIYSDDMAKVRTAQRQAVNAVVQGSCADIICEAIPPIQQAMKEFGGSLLLQVHDELVAEVPEEYAESAARIMERLMVERVNQELRVPLEVSAGIGESWATAK